MKSMHKNPRPANKGLRRIKNGTHEVALKRVAKRLKVPYGKKERP